MSTYLNCYEILTEVRQGLNEYTSARLQATSTSGAYLNDYLVKKINQAQNYIYALLFKLKPEFFLAAPATIAVTASVITKPSDYYRLYELRDADGYKVYRSDARDLPVTGSTGSENLYYEQGSSLRLNKSGVTDTYNIVYYTKPRELTQGKAAGVSTLATSARAVADYYNNVQIESITDDSTSTITDYTAARVCTLSGGTLASASFYGTISKLPESLHCFLAPKAIQLVNMEFPIAQGSPSGSAILQVELNDWKERLIEEMTSLVGDSDVDIESIFADYVSGGGYGGVNVPRQGYRIA